VQSIVISPCLSAFLSVCLSICSRNSDTTRPNFTPIFMHVSYGPGSVLLWRLCDTLCTSGFVDDVMFSLKGPLARYVGPIFLIGDRTTSITAKIPARFCLTIKTNNLSNYPSWVEHRGRSLISTIILLTV